MASHIFSNSSKDSSPISILIFIVIPLKTTHDSISNGRRRHNRGSVRTHSPNQTKFRYGVRSYNYPSYQLSIIPKDYIIFVCELFGMSRIGPIIAAYPNGFPFYYSGLIIDSLIN